MSAGSCNSCASPYVLSGTAAGGFACVLPSVGSACATGSSCTSGICLGGSCCTSAVDNCASCSPVTAGVSAGLSNACTSPYALTGSATSFSCTTLSVGSPCVISSDCTSNVCVGGFCCSDAVDNCISCAPASAGSSAGLCNSCASPYLLTRQAASDGGCANDPSCVLGPPGQTCAANNECSSALCVGGFCCVGAVSNCTACNSLAYGSFAGVCNSCQLPLLLSGNSDGSVSCVQRPAGSSCSANSDCTSNVCAGGFCCIAAVPSCTACSSSALGLTTAGRCASCSPPFLLTGDAGGGFGCSPLPFGYTCMHNSDCASGMCVGGVCCSASTSNCIACSPIGSGAVTGLCSSCNSSFLLNGDAVNGFSCELGSAGFACSANSQCISSNCLGGYCCSTAVDQCTACSPLTAGAAAGMCSSCTSPYVPSGDTSSGYVCSLRPPGAACVLSSDCTYSNCTQSICIPPPPPNS